MATAGSLQASPLRGVPLEVLLRITDFLPTTALGALRLSCRAIQTFLDTSFIKEFFTRKQFMITVFSLKALIEISESRLGPHLRFLHLGLDRLDPLPINQIHGDRVTPEKRLHYNNLLAAERYAKANGTHRDMLATAFKKLPNLESILIRDHNSRRRTRDGWNAEWKSYGFETVFETTGMRPSYPRRTTIDGTFACEASDVFSQVLHACALSGARPRGIEVITQRMALSGHAFYIPDGTMQQSIVSVIEGLEKLHLNLLPAFREDGGPDLYTRDLGGTSTTPVPSSVQDFDYLLHQFLYKANNLKDLRINQMYTRITGNNNPAHYLLDWLVAAATSSSPILPKLQHISFGRSTVKAEVLTRLIGAFAKQLESLELWRITLFRPLPQLAPGEKWPKVNFWSSFLRNLRQIPDLNLHHVKFGLMGQNHVDGNGRFGPLCMVGITGTQNIDYTGSDWRKHLEEKESEIEISWEYPYERIDDGTLFSLPPHLIHFLRKCSSCTLVYCNIRSENILLTCLCPQKTTLMRIAMTLIATATWMTSEMLDGLMT